MAGLQIPVETKGAERNLDRLEKGFKDVGTASTKADTRLKGFRGTMSKMTSPLRNLTSGFGALKIAVIGLVGGLALGGLARSFLNAAKTSENFRVRLKILLGSAEAGQAVFQSMSKYASEVPFQFEEIMESATRLSGVLTGGVDEINRWMPMIGNLAAAMGMSIEDTTGQISRMLSAGAGAADLFRDKGVLAFLGFQAGATYSVDETRAQLEKALSGSTSLVAGATDALANTWTGLMSMMGDAWFQFRNLVMDEGVFEFMKLGLKRVLELINQVKAEGRFEGFAKDMGQSLLTAFEVIVKGAALVGDAFRGWKMIWFGLKSAWHAFSLVVYIGNEAVLRAVQSVVKSVDGMLVGLGKRIQSIGEYLHSDIMTAMGENLQSGGFADALSAAADESARLADEHERALYAANDQLVAVASQESLWSRAGKLVKGMRKEVDGITAAMKGIKMSGGPTAGLGARPGIGAKKIAAGDQSMIDSINKEARQSGMSAYQKEMDDLEVWKAKAIQVAGDVDAVRTVYADRRDAILEKESERSEAEFRKMEEDGVQAVESLGEAMLGLGDTIDSTFIDGFTQGFMDFATGAKSAKDAFHDFAINTTKWLAEMLIKTLLLNAAQQAGGIWGGIAGGIAQGISGARANGGPVTAGKQYVVGERGPETFVPKQSGSVQPNSGNAQAQAINIINVTDKSMMDEYMFSEGGQKAIMNVVSANASKVKRIIR